MWQYQYTIQIFEQFWLHDFWNYMTVFKDAIESKKRECTGGWGILWWKYLLLLNKWEYTQMVYHSLASLTIFIFWLLERGTLWFWICPLHNMYFPDCCSSCIYLLFDLIVIILLCRLSILYRQRRIQLSSSPFLLVISFNGSSLLSSLPATVPQMTKCLRLLRGCQLDYYLFG